MRRRMGILFGMFLILGAGTVMGGDCETEDGFFFFDGDDDDDFDFDDDDGFFEDKRIVSDAAGPVQRVMLWHTARAAA